MNQNPEEGVIQKVRQLWFIVLIRNIVPKRIWYYGFQCTTQVMHITSTQANGLRVECSLHDVMGETVDISEYLEFLFYNFVYYKENAGFGLKSIGM